MNTKRLTTLAMMISIYVVLSVLTPVKIINFKFTFEAFPILAAALSSGPVDGLIVGTLGSFIYQLLFSGYGLTPTTPLWILPHAFSGLIVGLYAKKKNFDLKMKDIAIIAIISAFSVTMLNTLALYVDSKIYGYYSKTLVFGNLIFKIIAGAILAIIYASILPRLLDLLKKNIRK